METKRKRRFKQMEKPDTRMRETPTAIAAERSITISGGGNTINDSSIILRFLSIIEEQNRTIARQQEEIYRLRGYE